MFEGLYSLQINKKCVVQDGPDGDEEETEQKVIWRGRGQDASPDFGPLKGNVSVYGPMKDSFICDLKECKTIKYTINKLLGIIELRSFVLKGLQEMEWRTHYIILFLGTHKWRLICGGSVNQ